jgi:hypothetical protein
MDKEQELLTMCKYMSKESSHYFVMEVPNVFLIKNIDISATGGYYDTYSKYVRADFMTNTATYRGSHDSNAAFKEMPWDKFVEQASHILRWRIENIVHNKIIDEEQQKAKCVLKRRIGLELRSVV